MTECITAEGSIPSHENGRRRGVARVVKYNHVSSIRLDLQKVFTENTVVEENASCLR